MSDTDAAGRAEHYRHMAEATRELASHTQDPEIRSNYLALATRWLRLAERAEREARSAVLALEGEGTR
jgi:hypothetical protein